MTASHIGEPKLHLPVIRLAYDFTWVNGNSRLMAVPKLMRTDSCLPESDCKRRHRKDECDH